MSKKKAFRNNPFNRKQQRERWVTPNPTTFTPTEPETVTPLTIGVSDHTTPVIPWQEIKMPKLPSPSVVNPAYYTQLVEEMNALQKALTSEDPEADNASIEQLAVAGSWKDFLTLDAYRLQPANTHTQFVSFSADAHIQRESVPQPTTAHALRYKPSSVFRAAANEWYVESGKVADNAGGSGYMVTRMFVQELAQFRWFCTCVKAKKSMYTEDPYCKHMYAVQQYIYAQESPIYSWTAWTTMQHVAEYLAWLEVVTMQTSEDAAYLDELLEALPQLQAWLTTSRINLLSSR